MTDPKRTPDPIDCAVGARVRLLRQSQKMSQATLADALGVTFQQIQKYERGTNRISISSLTRIARALGTTIPELVDETTDESRPLGDITDLIREPATLELVRAFRAIPEGGRRRALLELARSLAEKA